MIQNKAKQIITLMLQLIPESSKISSKVNPPSDAEKTFKHITQNITHFEVLVLILELFLRLFPKVTRLFGDLFLGASWGYPLDRFGPNLNPLVQFSSLFIDFRNPFIPNVKGSRAVFRSFVNKLHQPRLQQKQAVIQPK